MKIKRGVYALSIKKTIDVIERLISNKRQIPENDQKQILPEVNALKSISRYKKS
jgi:hypothetical protein